MANLDQILDYVADDVKNRIVIDDIKNTSTVSITAGTIGTYSTNTTLNIAKSGYKPIVATLRSMSHPASYMPIVALSSSENTATVYFYRPTGSAYTIPANDFTIRVVYVKDVS